MPEPLQHGQSLSAFSSMGLLLFQIGVEVVRITTSPCGLLSLVIVTM
jgi:hypothetical protein